MCYFLLLTIKKKIKIIENIKNFDKLKTEEDREFVRTWSKITTITINNDGFYMLDIITEPGFSDAKIYDSKKIILHITVGCIYSVNYNLI